MFGSQRSEVWEGNHWIIDSTPVIPDGSRDISLMGVSCASQLQRTIVGEREPSAGGVQPLVETWDSNLGAWVVEPSPNPSEWTYGVLSGISCTAASTCTTVGWSFTNPDNIYTFAIGE